MLCALFDIKAIALELGFQKMCIFFMATNNNNVEKNLFYEAIIGEAKL